MFILGLNFGHDASVCALKDGKINEGRYKNYIAMLKGDKGYR